MNPIPVRSGNAGVCKFLLLDDGTLLFGFFGEHRKLWRAYCSDGGTTEDSSQRPTFVAAGIVRISGKVCDWSSFGYGVETPRDLRPHIEEFFADNADLLCAMYDEALS